MILSTVKNWNQAYNINKQWQCYYEHDIESPIYLNQKEEIIKKWLNELKPKTVIDLGANTGRFSFLAAKEVEQVIALESDYNCVDAIESAIDKTALKNITVMQMDLAETTPSFGVLEKEYSSIFKRLSNIHLSPSLVMALAIVHHLHISNFLSFAQIAELLAKFNSKYLIIEFVPIQDSKVQLLIKNKQRDFSSYTQENFTTALLEYFKLEDPEITYARDHIKMILQASRKSFEDNLTEHKFTDKQVKEYVEKVYNDSNSIIKKSR